MKAILLKEPGRFEHIVIDEAKKPAAGEALVRVHRIGICGTDISGYLGKMPFYSYPRIPGHELGVEVLEVGPDVVNVKAGDRCSIEPYMNCQRCFACRRGGINCCENLQVLGVHTDGGMRPRSSCRPVNCTNRIALPRSARPCRNARHRLSRRQPRHPKPAKTSSSSAPVRSVCPSLNSSS